VVPIIANGLRVYFTILIGDTWGLKYATGTDHMIFGWQFFGTVLVLLLLVGWFFRDPLVVVKSPPAINIIPSGARMAVWPAVIVLLLSAPVWAAGLSASAPVAEIHVSAPVVPGWSGPQAAAVGWQPTFNGAAGQVKASYRSQAGGAAVEFFHAIYIGKPRRGHSLITFGNQVYDPALATILSSASRQLTLTDGRNLTVGELRLSGAAGHRVVWYWYCVDRRCSRSQIFTKTLQAWDVLRGHMPQSSVWALSAPVGYDGVDQARANLRAFAQKLPASNVAWAPTRREQAPTRSQP
jgi:EpsI family protein